MICVFCICLGLSFGSALVIVVSILNEEFQPATLRELRRGVWRNYNAGLAADVHSDATVSTSSSSVVAAAAVTATSSFRYGWSFYVALAAFVSAELAAVFYILLHKHTFKLAMRNNVPLMFSKVLYSYADDGQQRSKSAATLKETAVQTSPCKYLTQHDQVHTVHLQLVIYYSILFFPPLAVFMMLVCVNSLSDVLIGFFFWHTYLMNILGELWLLV